MNYIIFDLEFNQLHPDHKENKTDENIKLPFEIIQIGAFKMNENFKVVSTFNALIKPELYKVIHPYVQDLTKLSEEDLIKCKSFPSVYKDFLSFLGKSPCVFCVWGKSDIKELIRNIKFYNLDFSSLPTKYIDIQSHASKHFKMQKGMKIGLKTAVEQLGLEIKSDFH
ncbi:exonuclease domain-containing protein, partial [Clostridium sp.]|uniref:exonuclease domain-containing protein n=1 Tax=Clostridium sp. TaxID=1506 RepID=UPI003F3AE4FD